MDSTQIPAMRRLSARIASCMIPSSSIPHLHTRILKIVKAMLKTRYSAFLSRMHGSVVAQSRRELYLRSISIPFHWRLSCYFLLWSSSALSNGQMALVNRPSLAKKSTMQPLRPF
ncbi:hypothetical protein L208DRAFT_882851 [Tricholoma matsutake]|nr:hypothetical protein L208DRAFT_882851 [Tricholoma matsutake 945]